MAVIRQGGGAFPPVQLDPVQQLVNVHWPKRGEILFVALATRVVLTGTGHPFESFADFCTPETSELISSAEMADIEGGPGVQSSAIDYPALLESDDKIMSVQLWEDPEDESGPGWVWGDATVTGMPTDIRQSGSYDAWSYGGIQSTNHGWVATPAAGPDEPSFYVVPQKPPHTPGDFSGSSSPQYITRARPYTEEPACYRTGPPLSQRRYGARMGDELETLLTLTLDLSSVSVTAAGKTFAPVATAIRTTDSGDLLSGHRSMLWILCAPVEETS